MARKSNNQRIPGALPPTLVKADSFAGLQRGDKVRVLFPDPTDILAKYANIKWEFVSHVTDIANGSQWLDLWGGARGHEHWMCVRPNRVIKVDSRRKL